MDNDKNMVMTEEVMRDQDYQNINARTVDIWLLMCACQSMQTIPGLHDLLRATYKDLGKRLQSIVVAIHPNVKSLAEAGWDRTFDYSFSTDFDDDDDVSTGFSILDD